MMTNQLKQFICCAFVFVLLGLPTQAMAETFTCPADESWFPITGNKPEMPTEVPDTGSNAFCGFYQFSWQAFLYLMSPSPTGSLVRNFEVQANYPVLEHDANGTPLNSCDDSVTGNTHKVSLAKSSSLPEDIHQAGDNATIYDQNGNVVYYEVKFNKKLCEVTSIQKTNNFPSGTTELKFAWKVLTDKDDKSKFITTKATIGGQSNINLGLVGMHIAIATENHPEFIWATFEHKNNAPDCVNAKASTPLFTNPTCTNALVKKKDIRKIINCDFNQAESETSITGTPTEICRVYAYGTASGDLKATENVDDITDLNANVLAILPNAGPAMKVLENYFNVGAIWVSDITKGSDVSNQRGSLRLANTVAETTFQNVDLHKSFVSNCFGCHNYAGTSSTFNKNTTSGSLSHIFDDIAIGKKQCISVQAGPIDDNADARKKCPNTCSNSSSNLTWNGQWVTTQLGTMSVCGCCGK